MGCGLRRRGATRQRRLEGVALNAPSLSLVSSLTGRAVDRDQTLDGAYWRQQAVGDPPSLSGCAETLAALGVDVVIEIGRDAVLAPLLVEAWPKTADNEAAPTLLPSLRQSSGGEEGAAGQADSGFVEAVARGLRGGARRVLRGALRRRDPAAHLATRLSVPAPALLAPQA